MRRRCKKLQYLIAIVTQTRTMELMAEIILQPVPPWQTTRSQSVVATITLTMRTWHQWIPCHLYQCVLSRRLNLWIITLHYPTITILRINSTAIKWVWIQQLTSCLIPVFRVRHRTKCLTCEIICRWTNLLQCTRVITTSINSLCLICLIQILI